MASSAQEAVASGGGNLPREAAADHGGVSPLVEWVRGLEQQVAAYEVENRLIDAAIVSLDRGGKVALVLPAEGLRHLEDELLSRHGELSRARRERDELREELEQRQIEARGLAHDLVQSRDARRRAAVDTATLRVALEESFLAYDAHATSTRGHEQLGCVRALVRARAAGSVADARGTAGGGGEGRVARAEPSLFHSAGDADLLHRAHIALFGLGALADTARKMRADVSRLERSVERTRTRIWAEDRAALRTARELSAAALERVVSESGQLAPMLENGCLPLLLATAASTEELRIAAQVAADRSGSLREARHAQRVCRLQVRATQCRELLAAIRTEPAAVGTERALDVRAQTLLLDAELRSEVTRLRDLSQAVKEEEARLFQLQRYNQLCDAHVAALALESVASSRSRLLEREEATSARLLVNLERRLEAVLQVAHSASEEDLGTGRAAVAEKRERVEAVAASVAKLRDDINAVLELAAESHLGRGGTSDSGDSLK